ncbi:NAD(P)-dependent oxidoreductase [Candidatus Pelagibacter sp.]|nr:NAD(P)-dependent oxidoreductase [Candidatus Pelagibacter sp.]
MKRAIIAGGNGLIGRALIEELIKEKIPTLVLGTSRNIQKDYNKIKYKDIQYYQIKKKKNWLQNSITDIKKIFPTKRCVFFNLAWKGEKSLTYGKIEIQLENVNLSSKFLTLAKELGIKKYIMSGSHEEIRLKRYVDGKHWRGKKNLIKPSWYALSKVSCQKQIAFEAYHKKIDFCYVRISVVIDVNLNTNKFIENSFKDLLKSPKKILTNNNELYNVSSSNEIARQLIAVAKRGINNKIYTLGTGDCASLGRYFYRFSKTAHPKSKIIRKNLELKNLSLLKKKDFDIKNLITDTGYKPKETTKTLFKMLMS